MTDAGPILRSWTRFCAPAGTVFGSRAFHPPAGLQILKAAADREPIVQRNPGAA